VIAAVDVSSPYKGLAPFEDSELDALLFFGRERESELVAMNILAARLTVLYGPTGVGKSSLLGAGVAQRLRDLAPEADVVVFSSWRDDPVTALRELIAPAALEGSLGDAAADRADELYLVLDQFEEYFLYHGDARGESTLIDELPELVNSDLRVNVLLGIREDSLAKLDAFKARLPRLFGNYLRLDHLDRDAARAAILGPLARYAELGGTVWGAQPELVESVLDEVAAGKIDIGGTGQTPARNGRKRLVEAPYLQLVLQRLWELESARGSTTLTLATLRALGGAERIVEDHLERAMGTLTPSQQDAAAVMFDHLVTPSGSKIALRLSDLAMYASLETAALAPVVGALEHERILRPLRDGTNGDGSYEIYHDVLAEAVRVWRQRYEGQRELRLERKRARERNRRTLVALVIVAAALAVMTALTVYAFSQRSEAQQQAAIARDQQEKVATSQRKALAALAGERKAKANAVELAKLATANKRKAEENEEEANANAAEAQEFAEQATENEELATENADRAEANEETAEANAQDAEESAAAAEDAKREAEGNAADALSAKEDALRQQRRANRNARTAQNQSVVAKTALGQARRDRTRAHTAQRIAQVRAYVAQAEANLETDPQQSLKFALDAADTIAQDVPAVLRDDVEDVLRRALVAIRVLAILPSGGRGVIEAVYSKDGTLIGVASDNGVRIFRASNFKLLHRRLVDSAGATTLAFDPRGTRIASGARDGTIRVWDVSTGALTRTLTPADKPVRSISLEFSPDGERLLGGNQDNLAHLWETDAFVEVRKFPLAAQFRGAQFSHDGRYILTFTAGRAVRIFDTATGTPVAVLMQQGEVTAAAWSPTGETVTSAGLRNVYIWSAKTWDSEPRHLLSHGASVSAVAYTRDGSRVVSVGSDGQGRVWSIDTGAVLNAISGQRNRVVSVAVGPDGRVATGSLDQTLRIWLVGNSGATFVSLAGHTDTVSTVVFSPDGTSVLTGSPDGDARVWSSRGEPQLVQIDRHEVAATSVEANRDGSLAVSGGADGVARIWNDVGPLITLPHGGKEVLAVLDAKEQRVLTWGDDGSAKLWTLRGVRIAEFNHGAPVAAASLSADGRLLATAGADGVVGVWSASRGRLWSAKAAAPLSAVAFSPDGKIVATAATSVAHLFNARTGAVQRTLQGHTNAISELAFSPNGRLIATASLDSTARISDVASGTLRQAIDTNDLGLTSIEFSPDGKGVLTAGRDGDATIWPVAAGRGRISFRGHGTALQDARFSDDGRWVVTASGAAGLWDARTGKLIFFLRGHTGILETASFSGDGRRIFTGGRTDGTIRVYRCELCGSKRTLEKMARSRLNAIDRAARNARG